MRGRAWLRASRRLPRAGVRWERTPCPANPAISVTVVIAPLASTPSMWVRWAKQGFVQSGRHQHPQPHPYQVEVPDLLGLREREQQEGAEQGAHPEQKRAVPGRSMSRPRGRRRQRREQQRKSECAGQRGLGPSERTLPVRQQRREGVEHARPTPDPDRPPWPGPRVRRSRRPAPACCMFNSSFFPSADVFAVRRILPSSDTCPMPDVQSRWREAAPGRVMNGNRPGRGPRRAWRNDASRDYARLVGK